MEVAMKWRTLKFVVLKKNLHSNYKSYHIHLILLKNIKTKFTILEFESLIKIEFLEKLFQYLHLLYASESKKKSF